MNPKWKVLYKRNPSYRALNVKPYISTLSDPSPKYVNYYRNFFYLFFFESSITLLHISSSSAAFEYAQAYPLPSIYPF